MAARLQRGPWEKKMKEFWLMDRRSGNRPKKTKTVSKSRKNRLDMCANILRCCSVPAIMYQSNRSFNIPTPRAYPGHLTSSCPGGGNLINLIFPGAGIWSRADSTRGDKSCRRQALMHSKRKIPDSWRTGWKAKACTSFFLYLKIFKNHLHYLWHVRVLS